MPPRVEKLERVADLLLLLLNAKEPLTLVQIGSQIPGYPTDDEARRTQFERDKRTLRESGIPITVSSPNSSAQDGYQILAADYYLPDLDLSEPERDALRLALASVQFEGIADSEIAVKIGASPEAMVPPVIELPREPALGQLGQAVRERSVVTFTYRGQERVIEPEALAFRSGHWYLVGNDRTREGVDRRRTFRTDRILGRLKISGTDEFTRSDDLDVAHELSSSLRARSLAADVEEEGYLVAELLVDPAIVPSVRAVIGDDVVIEGDAREGSLVKFAVQDESAVVRWILGLGANAEVLGPKRLRDEVISRLQALYLATDRPPVEVPEARETVRAKKIVKGSTKALRRSSLDAGARLRRMIAILTFLADAGSASVNEIAAQFSIDAATVVKELELAACFGVPPYSPAELLEIVVMGDEVLVHRLEALERPLRLTPDEGFALAAAARTLLCIEGVSEHGPLASATEKLQAVLGQDRVYVEVKKPPFLDVLRRCAAENVMVDIDYLRRRESEPLSRRVEPVATVFREGNFYLDAFCHLADDWRRFLIDNITNVAVTPLRGEARRLPTDFLGSRAFVENEASQQVVILAESTARYALEPLASGPIEELEEDRIVVRLAVGDEEWLGRLLLGLGEESFVIEPSRLQHVRQREALAALHRYGSAIV